MAWIELHDNLPDHPKTIHAAALLKLDKDMLTGKLMRLWTWALRNRLSGFLPSEDMDTVAEVMRWNKKPAALLRALCAAPKGYDHGFLDAVEGGYVIHDWDVYTSQFCAQDAARKKDRERKRRQAEVVQMPRPAVPEEVAVQPAAKAPQARKKAVKSFQPLSAGIPAEQTRNSSSYQYPTLREEEEEEEDTYALAHAGEEPGDDRADRRNVHSYDQREEGAAALAGSSVDACTGTPSMPAKQPQLASPPHSQPSAAPPTPAMPNPPGGWKRMVEHHLTQIGPMGEDPYAQTLQTYIADLGVSVVLRAIDCIHTAGPDDAPAPLLRLLADWQAAGVHDDLSAQVQILLTRCHMPKAHRQPPEAGAATARAAPAPATAAGPPGSLLSQTA